MKGPTHLDQWQEAQITTSCTRIGNWVDDSYQKDVDCQESLKELLRYLRRDNDYFSVRRLLGEYEIVQRHLIPLLITCGEDKGIFNISLRLLVNLTTPPLLLWREEIPADRESRSVYLQLKSHQSSFKEAFSSSRFWETVSKRLQELLNLEWDNRQEDDKIQLEMVLILVRNALHIPPSDEDKKRTSDDASSHDQVVWALHESGITNLLLYIASSDSETSLCMHVLEVISRMLRDSDPSDLAGAGKPMSASRREESTKSLVQQKLVEEKTRAQRNAKLSTRHSRFGGIYSVQGVKSVGERDATVTKPIFDPAILSQDHLKGQKRVFGRANKIQEEEKSRKSTLAIRLILRDFCLEFVNSAYNSLMHVVKDSIVRHRTMANDESYYLWALKFFMEFNRNYSFKLELVSETLTVDLFHYVQSCIELYMSNIQTDKRNLNSWNQRMQRAMAAYKELLLSMVALDNSKTEAAVELSQHIKSHIFYQMEYRELCLQLLQTYNPNKLSKSFLKDLIESTHVFFKLLESFATKNRHIVVQKKGKRKSSKKKKAPKMEKKKPVTLTEEEAEQTWEKVKPELEKGLSEMLEIPEDVVPFDPASDESMDDQKRTAVKRIQRLMREEKAQDAVALLRAARDIWPDGDVFASASSSPEEELEVMKEIFFYEFPADEQVIEDTNGLIDDAAGNSQDDEDEEEENHMPSLVEQEFDFKHYQLRLCHAKVVSALNLQLASYDKQTTFANHATIKLMHRIAWDCNHPTIFFQATLFRTFQRVLRDYRMKIDPAVKEIGKFAHFILRKLAEVSKTNQKVFVELLFPKTNKEAVEIEHGYGTYSAEGSKGSKSAAWAEEEEFELEQLYDEFKDKEGDVVQMICDALINQNRSKRQVSKKLKAMGVDVKELTKRSKGHIRARKDWNENEIQELRELVEKFLDSHDPLGRIMEHMTVKRPKHRVKQKILDLCLVSDPSQLKKKRISKNKSHTKRKRRVDEFEELIEQDEGRRQEERQGSGASDSDADSDGRSDSDSSSSDDDTPLRPKQFVPHMLKKSQGQKRSQPNKTQPTQEASRDPTREFVLEIAQTSLTAAVTAGHGEALHWLLESLEEIVTERETDELNGLHETVPLVPVADPAYTALDDDLFLELLASLGFGKPILGQEQYWRVPGTISNAEIQRRCRVIRSAIMGESMEALDENGERVEARSPILDLDEPRDDSVVSPASSDQPQNNSDSDAEIDRRKVKKRARIDSDSE